MVFGPVPDQLREYFNLVDELYGGLNGEEKVHVW